MDTTCLRSNQGELVRYESHYAQIKGHRDIYTIPRVTTLHRYIDGTVKRTRHEVSLARGQHLSETHSDLLSLHQRDGYPLSISEMMGSLRELGICDGNVPDDCRDGSGRDRLNCSVNPSDRASVGMSSITSNRIRFCT